MELQFISWHEWKWKWSDPFPAITGTQTAMKKRHVWKKGGSEWGGVTEDDPCLHWAMLSIGHVLPCQMRPITSFKEVKAWRGVADGPGQMDRHMAWALSFRCSACRVALNKAQVHKFKSFTGAIWKFVSSVTVWFGIEHMFKRLLNIIPSFQKSVSGTFISHFRKTIYSVTSNHQQHCLQEITFMH